MTIKKVNLPNKEIRWEVCERLPGHGEKRIRRRFEKKVDAQVFLDSLKDRKKEALQPNTVQATSDIEGTTFNSEAEHWLKKKGGDFTEGYFRVINPGLNKIRNLYGHFPISRFTPGLLFEFRLLMKDQGLSGATQNRYCDLITRIINFSFKQKRINFNPVVGYEKGKENQTEMQFWDEGEVISFLNLADKKYPRGSKKRWIYAVYLLALETGARAREIWGFKILDIPKTGTKIKILRQALGANRFTATKGKDSRFVPFSFGLREEIESLLNDELEELDSNWTIFRSKVNTPIDHDNFSERVFEKDIEESGARRIRFHDLRHTAITLMVKKGVLLPMIQKIAGHKDIKTTMRYVHVLGKDIDDIGAIQGLTVTTVSKKVLKLVGTTK